MRFSTHRPVTSRSRRHIEDRPFALLAAFAFKSKCRHVARFAVDKTTRQTSPHAIVRSSARSFEETQNGDGGAELKSSFRAGVGFISVLPAGLRADVGFLLHCGAGTYSCRCSPWPILGASGCVRALSGGFVGHSSHRGTPWRRHAIAWRH